MIVNIIGHCPANSAVGANQQVNFLTLETVINYRRIINFKQIEDIYYEGEKTKLSFIMQTTFMVKSIKTFIHEYIQAEL